MADGRYPMAKDPASGGRPQQEKILFVVKTDKPEVVRRLFFVVL